MGRVPVVPEVVDVKRTDQVYAAHAYLTKVPLPAIEPFIEAFTEPGDLVLDPFAGSGMTGVAAAVLERSAVLYDISELGRHVGTNYVNLVDAERLRKLAEAAVRGTVDRIGDVYSTVCAACGRPAELSKSVVSIVVECRSCGDRVNYYDALKDVGWHKSKVECPHCEERLQLRGARRVAEEHVQDVVSCDCQPKLREQEPIDPPELNLEGLTWPDVAIGEDLQMFQASALAKHQLRSTASFYSQRNLAALAALKEQIDKVEEPALRNKLLFAFTAILTRASKRYQWSPKRPLNAANQNYYIAPVFYEWNVFDLFLRKVEAVIKSDDFIRARTAKSPAVDYRVRSAHELDLPDGSVDYVFTDPPFGSNIFYSDMSLFQEAWLGSFTDPRNEAVVDRSGKPEKRRTPERYERLLTEALQECARVLKRDGWLTLVFSNSSGTLWALIQRAVRNAGFLIEPDAISTLNKGQRSVKGLASGFENVVTLDLMLSMRKAEGAFPSLKVPTAEDAGTAIRQLLNGVDAETPSHVYVQLIRHGLREHWDVSAIDFDVVTDTLRDLGFKVDKSTGRMHRDRDSA